MSGSFWVCKNHRGYYPGDHVGDVEYGLPSNNEPMRDERDFKKAHLLFHKMHEKEGKLCQKIDFDVHFSKFKNKSMFTFLHYTFML